MGRISISTHELQEAGRRDNKVSDLTSYMLGQDVSNQILPFRSTSKKEPIEINCEASKRTGIEGQINLLFHSPYEPLAHSAKESIVEFIRNTSHKLIYFRKIYYEIAEEQFDEKEKQRLRYDLDFSLPNFHLYSIPGFVFRLGNNCYQIVSNVKKANGSTQIIKIPKNKVWSVKLPEVFGSSFRFYLTKALREVSSQIIPKYLEGQNYMEDKTFNFSAYIRQRKLLAAQSTLNWGWNGRSQWLNDAPEFYYFYREIVFCKLLATVRDEILFHMNLLLNQIKIDAKIVTNDLPSPKDFEDLRLALISGKANYSMVTKKLRTF